MPFLSYQPPRKKTKHNLCHPLLQSHDFTMTSRITTHPDSWVYFFFFLLSLFGVGVIHTHWPTALQLIQATEQSLVPFSVQPVTRTRMEDSWRLRKISLLTEVFFRGKVSLQVRSDRPPQDFKLGVISTVGNRGRFSETVFRLSVHS